LEDANDIGFSVLVEVLVVVVERGGLVDCGVVDAKEVNEAILARILLVLEVSLIGEDGFESFDSFVRFFLRKPRFGM
jgi:hypothetical protein